MVRVHPLNTATDLPVPQVNNDNILNGFPRKRSGRVIENAPSFLGLSLHEREAIVLSTLLEDAEAGNAEAQFAIADKYYSCPEEERNYDLAQKWFSAAAAQDHTEAHVKLGTIFFQEKNYEKAMIHFLQASFLGQVTSRFKIAKMYERGLGVEQSYMQAFLWNARATVRNFVDYDQKIGKKRKKALKHVTDRIEAELLKGDVSEKNLKSYAKKGLVEAQYLLARHYGRNLKQKKAIKWLERVADKMQAGEIYYDIAEIYLKGESLKPNQKMGLSFLSKAANIGHVGAHMALAKIAQSKEQLPEAAQHFLKAAQRGDKEAQNEIGSIYASGLGLTQDLEAAFKWTRKSAQQGFVKAQHNLGEYYERGIGVSQNYDSAYECYYMAGEQNFVPSIAKLAMCLYQGKGCAQDYSQALYHYKRVCQLSVSETGMIEMEAVASAYYMVGRMFLAGQGTFIDKEEGFKWLRNARELGYEGAKKFLAKRGL